MTPNHVIGRSSPPYRVLVPVRPSGGLHRADHRPLVEAPPAGARLVLSLGVLIAIPLLALNLRPAVTSVGSMLADIRSGTGMSAVLASAVVAAPVWCFAAGGALAWAMRSRFGTSRTVSLALAVLAATLAARVLAGPYLLLAGTVVACLAIAVLGTLLPVITHAAPAKAWALLTGCYVAALGGGSGIGALITPQVAGESSWQLGVSAWALLAAAAWAAWRVASRRFSEPAVRAKKQPGVRTLAPANTAWSLTIHFGLTSGFTFSIMGWLPSILLDYSHVDPPMVEWLFTVAMALGVPIALLVPKWARATAGQSGLAVALAAPNLVAIVGLLMFPTFNPWLWAIGLGLGMPAVGLALAMISLRAAPDGDTAAALSSMVQGVGYAIAGVTALGCGLLHSSTDGWEWPILGLLVILCGQIVAGMHAGLPVTVYADGGSPVPAPRKPAQLPPARRQALPAREPVTYGRAMSAPPVRRERVPARGQVVWQGPPLPLLHGPTAPPIHGPIAPPLHGPLAPPLRGPFASSSNETVMRPVHGPVAPPLHGPMAPPLHGPFAPLVEPAESPGSVASSADASAALPSDGPLMSSRAPVPALDDRPAVPVDGSTGLPLHGPMAPPLHGPFVPSGEPVASQGPVGSSTAPVSALDDQVTVPVDGPVDPAVDGPVAEPLQGPLVSSGAPVSALDDQVTVPVDGPVDPAVGGPVAEPLHGPFLPSRESVASQELSASPVGSPMSSAAPGSALDDQVTVPVDGPVDPAVDGPVAPSLDGPLVPSVESSVSQESVASPVGGPDLPSPDESVASDGQAAVDGSVDSPVDGLLPFHGPFAPPLHGPFAASQDASPVQGPVAVPVRDLDAAPVHGPVAPLHGPFAPPLHGPFAPPIHGPFAPPLHGPEREPVAAQPELRIPEPRAPETFVDSPVTESDVAADSVASVWPLADASMTDALIPRPRDPAESLPMMESGAAAPVDASVAESFVPAPREASDPSSVVESGGTEPALVDGSVVESFVPRPRDPADSVSVVESGGAQAPSAEEVSEPAELPGPGVHDVGSAVDEPSMTETLVPAPRVADDPDPGSGVSELSSMAPQVPRRRVVAEDSSFAEPSLTESVVSGRPALRPDAGSGVREPARTETSVPTPRAAVSGSALSESSGTETLAPGRRGAGSGVGASSVAGVSVPRSRAAESGVAPAGESSRRVAGPGAGPREGEPSRTEVLVPKSRPVGALGESSLTESLVSGRPVARPNSGSGVTESSRTEALMPRRRVAGPDSGVSESSRTEALMPKSRPVGASGSALSEASRTEVLRRGAGPGSGSAMGEPSRTEVLRPGMPARGEGYVSREESPNPTRRPVRPALDESSRTDSLAPRASGRPASALSESAPTDSLPPRRRTPDPRVCQPRAVEAGRMPEPARGTNAEVPKAPAIPQPRDGDAPAYGRPRHLLDSTPFVGRAPEPPSRRRRVVEPRQHWAAPASREPEQLELALEPARPVEPRRTTDPDALRERTTYIPHPRRRS
jgi:CP family cyanate transporter-like MFS transporter